MIDQKWCSHRGALGADPELQMADSSFLVTSLSRDLGPTGFGSICSTRISKLHTRSAT